MGVCGAGWEEARGRAEGRAGWAAPVEGAVPSVVTHAVVGVNARVGALGGRKPRRRRGRGWGQRWRRGVGALAAIHTVGAVVTGAVEGAVAAVVALA